MTIQVLLADASPLIRAGLRNYLASQKDIRVIGETDNFEDLLDLIARLTPDILILDMNLPNLYIERLMIEIQKKNLAIKILAMGNNRIEIDAANLLKMGIKGYFLKNEEPANIIEAVSLVSKGLTWLSPIDGFVKTRYFSKSHEFAEYHKLTKREKDVLRLIAVGATNKEIATRLYISVFTVEFHVSNILRKLGLSKRIEAAMWVKEN